jgi:hypothetical protein
MKLMRKKFNTVPTAFAAPTKDTRAAGTFEVLVPLPGRAKPHRIPEKFETKEQAETWIHSQEGRETIERLQAGR